MDEKEIIFELLSSNQTISQNMISEETLLLLSDMLEMGTNHCYLNNSMWFFSRKGYLEFTELLKTNAIYRYYFAVIDYKDFYCLNNGVGNSQDMEKKKMINKIVLLSSKEDYDVFYNTIKKHAMESDYNDCSISNILIFSDDFSIILFINQRRCHSMLTCYKCVTNGTSLEDWYECNNEKDIDVFLNNQMQRAYDIY